MADEFLYIFCFNVTQPCKMFDDIYGRVAWVYICHGVLVRVRRQTCYSQFSPSMMRFSGLNSGVQTPQKALLFTEPLHWFQPNPFDFFFFFEREKQSSTRRDHFHELLEKCLWCHPENSIGGMLSLGGLARRLQFSLKENCGRCCAQVRLGGKKRKMSV